MFFKALVLLILTAAIFGSAAYYSYELFIRPKRELEAEVRKGPPPPPPDPTLPEFAKCQALEQQGDMPAIREAYAGFVERYPRSTMLGEAKARLGAINTGLFFSAAQAQDKQLYVVRPGDALSKVARRTKTTPELLMRVNDLRTINLQIGQKIYYTPAEFSLEVDVREKRATVLNRGRFFKEYAIRSVPKGKEPVKDVKPVRRDGKVTDRIAWAPGGGRVIFTDKEYRDATFWISLSVPGATLYSEPPEAAPESANMPPGGGLGLAPEDAAELAVLMNKGDPVVVIR